MKLLTVFPHSLAWLDLTHHFSWGRHASRLSTGTKNFPWLSKQLSHWLASNDDWKPTSSPSTNDYQSKMIKILHYIQTTLRSLPANIAGHWAQISYTNILYIITESVSMSGQTSVIIRQAQADFIKRRLWSENLSSVMQLDRLQPAFKWCFWEKTCLCFSALLL